MENEQGEVVIGPDEFGYVPDKNSLPSILPNDPGLGLSQLSSNIPENEGGGGGGGDECVVGQ